MGARYSLVVLLALAGSGACAALGELRNLIQPPRFEEAADRQAEIRLNRPGASQPLGGAGVRLWTEVTNPNAFGLTLGTLRGTLHIEGSRAADVDFPLGLSLRPAEQTVIPIDLSIRFADLPGLANAIGRRRGTVAAISPRRYDRCRRRSSRPTCLRSDDAAQRRDAASLTASAPAGLKACATSLPGGLRAPDPLTRSLRSLASKPITHWLKALCTDFRSAVCGLRSAI
jgi:hypothetical protein